MPSYTVAAGDTLSKIGSKLGIDYKTLIPQVKSGNANLIRPGEVFTWGNTAPNVTPAAAAPAPVAAPAAPAAPASADFSQTMKTNTTNLLNTQKADSAGFLGRYTAAIPQVVEASNLKYNVRGLNELATGLGNRIMELQTNSDGVGAGGYANAGQVDKAVSSNYLPRLQQATNQAQTAERLAQTDIGYGLKPYEMEAGLLSDRQAREITGYTKADENILSTLLKKEAMTFDEKQLAQALAIKEKEFGLEREKMAASERNSKRAAAAATYNPFASVKTNTPTAPNAPPPPAAPKDTSLLDQILFGTTDKGYQFNDPKSKPSTGTTAGFADLPAGIGFGGSSSSSLNLSNPYGNLLKWGQK